MMPLQNSEKREVIKSLKAKVEHAFSEAGLSNKGDLEFLLILAEMFEKRNIHAQLKYGYVKIPVERRPDLGSDSEEEGDPRLWLEYDGLVIDREVDEITYQRNYCEYKYYYDSDVVAYALERIKKDGIESYWAEHPEDIRKIRKELCYAPPSDEINYIPWFEKEFIKCKEIRPLYNYFDVVSILGLNTPGRRKFKLFW